MAVTSIERMLSESKRLAVKYLDRLRIFIGRQTLELSRSKAIDYHALRLLITHMNDEEVAFLQRSLGDSRIDLDAIRTGGDPSFFRGMLWVLALDQRWPSSVLRQVEYRVAGSSFKMELDLSLAPECTYFVEDPTPVLTRILRLGGGVFYDIGANVGFHSLTASLFYRQSHAFEPTPQTLTRLRKNASLNPGTRLGIHAVALSSTDGMAALRINRAHPGGNGVVTASADDREQIQVACARLDSYRLKNDLPGPDFVKIDVEGHEHDVLQGATATLHEYRPALFVECQKTEEFRRCLELLPATYEAYLVPLKGSPKRLSAAAELSRTTDVLFVEPVRNGLLQRLQST